MKKTLKKLTALFAALLMCGSPLLDFPDGSIRPDLSAWAAEETEHTEHSYDNGFCTSCQALQPAEPNAEATYEIGNAGQLYWFAGLVNGTLEGVEQDRAANAVLTADIVLNKQVLNDAGELNKGTFRPWTPMGISDMPYVGIFDGQGHAILGMYLNESGTDYVGLFRSASGTITNLCLEDFYVNGQSYVGGICGKNSETIR